MSGQNRSSPGATAATATSSDSPLPPNSQLLSQDAQINQLGSVMCSLTLDVLHASSLQGSLSRDLRHYGQTADRNHWIVWRIPPPFLLSLIAQAISMETKLYHLNVVLSLFLIQLSLNPAFFGFYSQIPNIVYCTLMGKYICS